jgi:hypothetical protein
MAEDELKLKKMVVHLRSIITDLTRKLKKAQLENSDLKHKLDVINRRK